MGGKRPVVLVENPETGCIVCTNHVLNSVNKSSIQRIWRRECWKTI